MGIVKPNSVCLQPYYEKPIKLQDIYLQRLSLNQINKWFAFNVNVYCTIDFTLEGQYTFALWLFCTCNCSFTVENSLAYPYFVWALFFPFSWINSCPIPMQLKNLIRRLGIFI